MTSNAAIKRRIKSVAKSQVAWDQLFERVFNSLDEPNPERRRELALDKTIRTLGRRPQTEEEKRQPEFVSGWFQLTGQYIPNYGQNDEVNRLANQKLYSEDWEFWNW